MIQNSNRARNILTLFILSFFLVPVLVNAQQAGIHEPGTGLTDPELKEEMQGTGQGLEDGDKTSDEELIKKKVQEIEAKKMQVNTQQAIHEPGTGPEGIPLVDLEDPELKEETQALQNKVQTKTQVKTTEAVKTQQGNGQQVQKGTPELYGDSEVDEKIKTKLREGTQSERALSRRSEVANAVQEMVKVADRSAAKGIGEQIRTIAQNQNQLQEEAEEALEVVQKRSGLTKFLIGPNYGQLKQVEDNLGLHVEKLKELKNLRGELSEADQVFLDEQISTMEDITAELEEEVLDSKKGFSLFGWLNRLISR